MNFSKKEVEYGHAIAGGTKPVRLVESNVERVGDLKEMDLSGFIMKLEPYEGRVYLAGD
jgi:hypothetical protein